MIPAPSELRPCRSCGQLILWTTTTAGRALAVDPAPAKDGNQACYRAAPRSWVSRSLDGADARPPAPWEDRYTPHVATCTRRAVQEQLPLTPTPMPPNVVPLDHAARARKRRRR